jgi:hypothetical protein
MKTVKERKTEETENQTDKKVKLRAHYKPERQLKYCMDFNRILFCESSDLRSGWLLVAASLLLRGGYPSASNSFTVGLSLQIQAV